jgi:general secretion pathway protein H
MPVRRDRGFTLLEVVVVVAIIALAMLVILPIAGKGASSADLKASARSLAAGLRAAQSNAMALRRDALLTIDVEQRLYTFSGEERTHKLPEGVDLKLYTAQAEVESEKKGSIRFYPDGSSTGGRITVSSGERKFLVDVDWLTGRVSIGE